jgi:hypothetical protein
MMKRFSKRPDIKIEIVSALKGFPPDPEKKKKRGEWWCPYCRKYRKFKHNSYLNVKECPVCTMNDRDYYVKLYNGMMATPTSIVKDRKERRKKSEQ